MTAPTGPSSHARHPAWRRAAWMVPLALAVAAAYVGWNWGTREEAVSVLDPARVRIVRTPGGLTPDGSTLADVLREFGDDHVFKAGDPLDEYNYPRQGIRVWIHRESELVNSFKIEVREP